MKATFQVHAELLGQDVSWWARTDDIPGLNVSADTLQELRGLIDEAAAIHLGPEAEVEFELVANARELATGR